MVIRLIVALACWLPAVAWAQRHAFNTESFEAVDVFGPFEVELVHADVDRVELDYRGLDEADVIVTANRGVSGKASAR